MFKKLTNCYPPTYDGAPNRKAFKDLIRGMEKLFDAQQCPKEWSVGFVGFYRRNKVDFW